MNMPSDYISGYPNACAIDARMAANYVAHMLIGDPAADELVACLATRRAEESAQLVGMAMNDPDNPAMRGAPSILRDFFKAAEVPPPWLDQAQFRPGIRMFHRNSRLVLAGMVGGALVEGFTTNISKSFFVTGRLRSRGLRRLQQNNRHMMEIFLPGGLERFGDGWKLSVRIRLIHAQVRMLLRDAVDWDTGAWGVPISAAHLGFALSTFSARLLKHLKSLGGVFDDHERRSFMQVWRYAGFLMGIPESILFREEADALKLFEVGAACEPPAGLESIAMAHCLVNSAPIFVGNTEPAARRKLARYVYLVSRSLIGKSLADQLRYPLASSFGVLPWFRLQTRYHRVMARWLPKLAVHTNLTDFMGLMTVSAYDEEGINYTLPQHAYAEQSGKW